MAKEREQGFGGDQGSTGGTTEEEKNRQGGQTGGEGM